PYAACSSSLHFTPFASTTAAPPRLSALSLHDALPISPGDRDRARHRPSRRLALLCHADRTRDESALVPAGRIAATRRRARHGHPDRKSTRLNSSHLGISYAVFCLKKKRNESVLTAARF